MKTVWTAVLLTLTMQLLAQRPEHWKYEINMATDNDWFVYHLESDRYYSFGLDGGLKYLPKRKGLFFPRAEKHLLAFSIHQQGFTPEYSDGLIEDDRPFAGWLFLSAREVYALEQRLIKVGLELGILGPSARAGEVQNWFHELAGFSYVNGWENQIADQPGLNLTFQYVTPVVEKAKWDVLAEGNASLGTVHTHVWPSVLFRMGKYNHYQQSAATNTSLFANPEENEWFFSMGAGIKYVVYDATLMGGLWEGETFLSRRDINELRFTAEMGVSYVHKGWSILFTYFYFSGEIDAGDNHRYGRLEVLRRF